MLIPNRRPVAPFVPEVLEPRRLFATTVPAAPAADAAPSATAPPSVGYHLTARPWQASDVTADTFLDAVEQVARAMSSYQDASGRIIDPFVGEEVQYSTPYYAFAIGVLVSAGRATDLLPGGVAAMDSATRQVGADEVPDDKGGFFLPPLAQAIELYAPHVPADAVASWRQRMSATSVEDLVEGGQLHNHRTYAMKGEWLRAVAGLVDRNEAIAFVEENWTQHQEWRLRDNELNLYRDETSDPDTFGVEPGGRVNLIALLDAGYDGPSRGEMEELLGAGTRNSMYLQDPTGQNPVGGRTDNHVWNDLVNGINFELMALRAAEAGDAALAGQYRRAASISVTSAGRWQLDDGTYAITKNAFDTAERVGFQTDSHFSNYNGYMLYHMAEGYLLRQRGAGAAAIDEAPAPSEIGGYAFRTSEDFAGAFANAGGMQLQAALRGDTQVEKENYWTPLGIDRISRAGWDSRLFGDGARDAESRLGVSFAPTFVDSAGNWKRLASIPDKYEGTFSVDFTHPLLVRAAITYEPAGGYDGPTFRNDLVITPDGILSTVTSADATDPFGVTWPVLASDGTPTVTTITSDSATARMADGTDELAYLAVHDTAAPGASVAANEFPSDAAVRGAYGDLLPVRATAAAGQANRTFVYPRNASDPTAAAVGESFEVTEAGFASALGRVEGDIYVGRTSAGGVGTGVDIDADGRQDVTFSESCGFVLQLDARGRVTAVETDRPVTATIGNRSLTLAAYAPASPNTSSPTPTPTPTPTPSPTPTPTPSAPRPPQRRRWGTPGAGVLGAVREAGSAGRVGGDRRRRGRRRVVRPPHRREVEGQVTYALRDLDPGTYSLTVRVRKDAGGGTLQIFSPQGRKATAKQAPISLASEAGPAFVDVDLGTFEVTGNKKRDRASASNPRRPPPARASPSASTRSASRASPRASKSVERNRGGQVVSSSAAKDLPQFSPRPGRSFATLRMTMLRVATRGGHAATR